MDFLDVVRYCISHINSVTSTSIINKKNFEIKILKYFMICKKKRIKIFLLDILCGLFTTRVRQIYEKPWNGQYIAHY